MTTLTLNRQQRRAAERASRKGGSDRTNGLTLNIIQVPSSKKFRIVEQGTQNFLRSPSGNIINFDTVGAAHQTLVRMKRMTAENLAAAQAAADELKASVRALVEEAASEGKITGLEGF